MAATAKGLCLKSSEDEMHLPNPDGQLTTKGVIWTIVFVIIVLLLALLSSGCDRQTREERVPQAIIDLKKGDIVLMNDGRACLVVQETRWIVGSHSNNPETYSTTLSCSPLRYERDFWVRELVTLSRGVAKPGDSNYDVLAADYVRQIIPKTPR